LAKYAEPVLVLGLGRFGLALTNELLRGGTQVLAVDRDELHVQRLSAIIPNVVVADSTDVAALRQVGAGEFSRAVVAMGGNQEASILTTSILSDMGVKQIWAKALNEQHARILARVGAHHVIQPENDMGERVAHLVGGRMLDYLEIDDNWVLAKAKPPQFLVGISLGESRLRATHRVTVVAYRPERETNFRHTDASTVLTYGDDILAMGTPADLEAFVE
jgi:trk system potassium uptake protein